MGLIILWLFSLFKEGEARFYLGLLWFCRSLLNKIPTRWATPRQRAWDVAVRVNTVVIVTHAWKYLEGCGSKCSSAPEELYYQRKLLTFLRRVGVSNLYFPGLWPPAPCATSCPMSAWNVASPNWDVLRSVKYTWGFEDFAAASPQKECKLSPSFLYWPHVEMVIFQLCWVERTLLKLNSPVSFSSLNVATSKFRISSVGAISLLLDSSVLASSGRPHVQGPVFTF